jgi:hypothetical protein
MAKRISAHTFDDEVASTAAPQLFSPSELYSDAELAAKFKVSLRTIKRWRSKGTAEPTIEFSSRTKRTSGHMANRMVQSRLKTA